MRPTILLLFLLVAVSSFGQFHIYATPTGQHEQYINYAEMAKGKYNQVKSLKQDSIEAIKADTTLAKKEKRKRIRAFKKRWKITQKQKEKEIKSEVENRLGRKLPDSITYPPKTPDDSLKWAMQVLASSGQYEEIAEVYAHYQSVDSTTMDSLEYAATQRSAEIAENFIPEEVKSELVGELPELGPGELFMKDVPKDQLPHVTMDDFSQMVPTDKMDGAVKSVTNLKKKYSKLPDINNLEGGVKKNSLKGEGLSKRLVIGGNLALVSTDPVVGDINVQLGYQMTKKWTVGAGLQWRESLSKDSIALANNQATHGYNGYMSYMLIKNIFGYAEYGGAIQQPLFMNRERERTKGWQYQYLLGVGSEIPLFQSIVVRVIVAYDFNHRNNDTHPRPFVVRVGFSMNGLPWQK